MVITLKHKEKEIYSIEKNNIFSKTFVHMFNLEKCYSIKIHSILKTALIQPKKQLLACLHQVLIHVGHHVYNGSLHRVLIIVGTLIGFLLDDTPDMVAQRVQIRKARIKSKRSYVVGNITAKFLNQSLLGQIKHVEENRILMKHVQLPHLSKAYL